MAIQIANIDDTNTLHKIGEVITEYKPYRNAFVDALMNRIGMVIITSKTWDNPWAQFKRGTLELGETIEEIFVNIANVHSFDPDTAEEQIFRREFPNVQSAFHKLNYQKFYKTTVSQAQLRTAFLAWEGITNLINECIQAMYTGANYDEYITMKYMLCRYILNGGSGIEGTQFSTNADLPTFVSDVKAISNKMEFLSTSYNQAGVYNATSKDSQYVFMDTDLDARVDVTVLAAAFNMDKASFTGHKTLIDSFAKHDTKRLAELFGDDSDYTPFTNDELAKLATIGAVIADKDIFMIFDNLMEMDNVPNGEGLYMNYWLHVWKTLSMSPFANCVTLVSSEGSVTAVTIDPDEEDVVKGGSLTLTAEVTSTGMVANGVTWSLSGATKSATRINGGVLQVAKTEPAGTELTVTATSIDNPAVSGTATITVVAS